VEFGFDFKGNLLPQPFYQWQQYIRVYRIHDDQLISNLVSNLKQEVEGPIWDQVLEDMTYGKSKQGAYELVESGEFADLSNFDTAKMVVLSHTCEDCMEPGEIQGTMDQCTY